jgi:UDP-N-acetylmuramoyl-L-alanyl-D-glutamate--2,6-diaminopimelate ligase
VSAARRGPQPLPWQEFLAAVGADSGAATGPAPAAVTGASYDSRRVQPGDAFFALVGQQADGARFARDAAGRGAACVVAEAPTGVREGLAADAPPAEVIVGEARRALAQATVALYRDPSARLRLVGLTGTNGKTTTAFLCRALLEAGGIPTGMIGTAGYWVGGDRLLAPHTTPEAPELCELLDRMSANGLAAAVMEVSSHALTLRRAYGLTFGSVVFTNLTRDHLDFHGTEEAYLAAKLRLFNGENGGRGAAAGTIAVVNSGEEHAPRVIEACRQGGMCVVRFAVADADADADAGAQAAAAELVAEDVVLGPAGSEFTLVEAAGGAAGGAADGARTRTRLRLPMPGRHNVENALAAWGAARALGVSREAAQRGLEGFAGVPGRLEAVDLGQPFTLLVDYAHTPDALSRVLAALRDTLAPGARLTVVFGCGGDRDRGKRAPMGEAAVCGAHRVLVTDDNPRSENPAVIRGEAMAGALAAYRAGRALPGAAEPLEVAGRRNAIEEALRNARPGDVVLLAGKGHEEVQVAAGVSTPFDDRVEARRALEGLLRRAGGGAA